MPFIALRTESRSVTSPVARSKSIPSSSLVLLRSRTRSRSSSPRPASSRTRWTPTKPVPPVTSVLGTAGMLESPNALEGEQERESDIADLQGFYERLRKSGEAVTTSQPSVGDFIAVYEPLLDEGKEIVSIHLSAGISGTYESAMQARERLTADGKGGERIAILDSRTGCGGMGLMILGAAHAAEQGASAVEAQERAAALRKQLKIWFAVDTL